MIVLWKRDHLAKNEVINTSFKFSFLATNWFLMCFKISRRGRAIIVNAYSIQNEIVDSLGSTQLF